MKMKRQLALLVISALLIGLLPMGNVTVSKADVSASAAEEAARTDYSLNNPTTDSDGVTTWDCVWFGSYWQEDTNGDGKADKKDAKQPIKWRVLSVEGDDVFLLADKNLDCQRYNDTRADVTWETCTMRSWLNGYGAGENQEGKDYSTDNFLANAFTSAEQSAIRTTNVVNDDNREYEIEGGNDTSDQIYLLSIDEVLNPSYGFTSTVSDTKTREAVNTSYVAGGGEVKTDYMNSAGSHDYWRLRSPGDSSSDAAGVNGLVNQYGYYVDYATLAVRPALHLNLSSDPSWSYAGTITSEGEVEEEAPPASEPTEEPDQKPTTSPGTEHSPFPTLPSAGHGVKNPTTDSDGVTTWDCVWFGNYWQEDTNGDGIADKNDDKTPIKWRVLSLSSEGAFLLADKNLECQSYNDISTNITWETCTMRSWLNGYGEEENQEGKDYSTDSFFANAFTSAEQSEIRTTSVVNDDNPEYGTEGGNDTSDQIYLLSLAEVVNPAYGFPSGYRAYAESRRVKNTEYAKTKGAHTNANAEYAGNGVWWLRSPGGKSYEASYVDYDGYVYPNGDYVYRSYAAVRPAMYLKLSSDSSALYAGTVTSEGEVKEVAPFVPGATEEPDQKPTESPGVISTADPSAKPTASPGTDHSPNPTSPSVTSVPTGSPGVTPTGKPTEKPTASPGTDHSPNPTSPSVTSVPTESPGITPTAGPSEKPTVSPGTDHSPNPTLPSVTSAPTEKPDVTPTAEPSAKPTASPGTDHSPNPTSPSVTSGPTGKPGGEPTMNPAVTATAVPTAQPTTTPGAVTPFVPAPPSQTLVPVLPPQVSPAVTGVGRVVSIKLKQKKRKVTASWKKVPGVAGYQLWYSTSKKWKGKKQKLIRKNKVTVKKLKKKKTYYFRVRAYRLDGSKKVYGAWSKRKKIKMKK